MCSVPPSCPTLCNPMDYSTSHFPVLHYLPQFAEAHVHQVSNAIQPSHPLLHSLLLPSIFPSIRVILVIAGMHGKSLQLCPTLCDSVDHNPPGSSVQGILQARMLKWVAMPFSRGSSQQWKIELGSPALQADSLPSEPPEKPVIRETKIKITMIYTLYLLR